MIERRAHNLFKRHSIRLAATAMQWHSSQIGRQ